MLGTEDRQSHFVYSKCPTQTHPTGALVSGQFAVARTVSPRVVEIALFLLPQVRLTERDCGEKNTREFGPWSGIRPTSVPFLANHLRQRAHCCFFDAMPIRQYLDGERFDLETTRLLGLAFETAIQALHNWGVD